MCCFILYIITNMVFVYMSVRLLLFFSFTSHVLGTVRTVRAAICVCVDKNWAVQGQTGQGRGRQGRAGADRAEGRAARQKDLGNFRIWFSGHGFQDLGSQLWGLGNFRIWFSEHGFQELGSQLWGLGNFRIWFSGHGFQDLGFQL